MGKAKQVVVQAQVNGQVIFDKTVTLKAKQRELLRECMHHIDTLGNGCQAIIRTQTVGARGWAVYRYAGGTNGAELDTAAIWADSLKTT